MQTLRYMFAFLLNIRRLGNIKGLIQDDIFLRKIAFYREIYLNKYIPTGLMPLNPIQWSTIPTKKKEDPISPLSLYSV